MAARKTTMDRLQELVRMHRLGTGTRESARLLKMSPNTERKYREALQAAGLYNGVIRAAFTPNQETELNRSYRELARHYAFKIDPTPPTAPKRRARSSRP